MSSAKCESFTSFPIWLPFISFSTLIAVAKTSRTMLNSSGDSSVQLLSCVWLFVTPWIAACQASLSIINSQSSLRLTSIKSVMPSSHLILGRPLLLLPAIPPSIKVFSNESTLRMKWPKYWSFSFSIIPSKEIPGMISFRMNWCYSLGTQKGIWFCAKTGDTKSNCFKNSEKELGEKNDSSLEQAELSGSWMKVKF